MKPETKATMDSLGLSLPFGWRSDFLDAKEGEHCSYVYDPGTDYSDCIHVKLTVPGTELVVTFGKNIRSATIPHEVIFAMFMDSGVYCMKAEEAKAIPALIAERDGLRSSMAPWKDMVESLQVQLRELLSVKKAKNRSIAHLVSELKRATARVFHQRMRIKELQEENAKLSRELRSQELDRELSGLRGNAKDNTGCDV